MIEKKIENMFRGKTIVITGGLGSIGSMIVKKLLTYEVKKLIILDNRETELFYAKSLYNVEKFKDERVNFIFADVRDEKKIETLFSGVEFVFHAAAMKHVIICEENPYDAVKTNIDGTKNIINACIKNNIEKMILISTDKAVNPSNVMGATKLLAEKLVSAMFSSNINSKTEFGIVRFGNVLNSRGSVLEIWNKQINNSEKISITDPKMTRFFMSIPQSVNLIFQATFFAKEGETFILKMPSVKIENLAKSFLEINSLNSNQIKKIGIRKGEKIHEELFLDSNEELIYEGEKLFIKFPTLISKNRINEVIGYNFKETKLNSFSSNNSSYLLNYEEIKNILLDELKLN